MIIYSKTCLPCSHKDLWKKVKRFARENNLLIEVRRTNRPEYKKEADQYSVAIPFAVNGEIAVSLNEELEKLL